MAKILYVEDNDDNIFMLKRRLEKGGYEVIIANDGLDGINKVKSDKPDLVLMDVGLPLMDGYLATKILKSDEETSHIPIIILTAHALITESEKAQQAGADDFETKPVNITSLLDKIEKLLNHPPSAVQNNELGEG